MEKEIYEFKNHYVTFGQNHIHRINDKIIDKDCVAVYKAPNSSVGRSKAFQLFDVRFCMEYHDTEWNEDNMKYYPRGYINID